MKKRLLTLCIVISILFTMPSCKEAVKKLMSTYFTLTNMTGYTLEKVYVRRANSGSWGDNLLSSKLAMPGMTTLSFQLKSNNNRFDLRAIDVDGDAFTKLGVEIKNGTSITLTPFDMGE